MHIPCFYIRNVIEDDSFAFDPSVLTLNNSCHLFGYWQSELYFKKFESQIRDDFKFSIPMSNMVNKEKAEILALKERAVALCVRRYQEVKQFEKLKLTEVDYYKKAIKVIQEKVSNPVFFVLVKLLNGLKKNWNLLV